MTTPNPDAAFGRNETTVSNPYPFVAGAKPFPTSNPTVTRTVKNGR